MAFCFASFNDQLLHEIPYSFAFDVIQWSLASLIFESLFIGCHVFPQACKVEILIRYFRLPSANQAEIGGKYDDLEIIKEAGRYLPLYAQHFKS